MTTPDPSAFTVAPTDAWDDDDHDFDGEVEDDGFDDCALNMDTGQCGHAGSEMCDFECPWRKTAHFAGNPGFTPKRQKGLKK